VLGLAGAGDERGVGEVLTRLRAKLRRPTSTYPTPRTLELAYLAQHAPGTLLEELVDLVRTRWTRWTAEEVEWMTTYWPSVAPPARPPTRCQPQTRSL